MFYVYILQSKINNNLYIGFTKDLKTTQGNRLIKRRIKDYLYKSKNLTN